MSRYVVLYQGAADPSATEERSLVSSFKKARVVDRVPGSILVEGPESEVAEIVGKLENWTFAPEQSMSANPPHRKIKQAG